MGSVETNSKRAQVANILPTIFRNRELVGILAALSDIFNFLSKAAKLNENYSCGEAVTGNHCMGD